MFFFLCQRARLSIDFPFKTKYPDITLTLLLLLKKYYILVLHLKKKRNKRLADIYYSCHFFLIFMHRFINDSSGAAQRFRILF